MKAGRTIQYFSDEYLEYCRKLTPEQILQFLEDYRLLHASQQEGASKLISLKVPEHLLRSFRMKSEAEGVAYQTQIKNLIREWLL